MTESMIDLVHALTENKYYVSDTLIPESLASALRDEAMSALTSGDYHDAGIGRQLTKRTDTSIRSDQILWWPERADSIAKAEYLAFLETLMEALNPTLYLGLRQFEGHYACYGAGAFYKKHIDQHRGVGARRLSVILYLNDFEAGEGGELVLYKHEQADQELGRVTPRFGRLAMFLTEDFPHEVLMATKERLSVTGWLRAQ